jgi:hypothetical protein
MDVVKMIIPLRDIKVINVVNKENSDAAVMELT